VDETSREWTNRKKSHGAILVFNCDRTAGKKHRDFKDDKIVNANELKDFSNLVVKQKRNLPKGCNAYLTLSTSDASKVRIFVERSSKPVVYAKRFKVAIDKNTTEYRMSRIRKRDYNFAIEAVTPRKESGDENVQINVVIRKGTTEKFNDHVFFTIAPWLMLSNVEDVEQVYVAHNYSNRPFVKSLRKILGTKLKPFPPYPGPPANIEVWMQDIMEIGFSSMPSAKAPPMHQLMNSANAKARLKREHLYQRILKGLIANNFGHLMIKQDGFRSLDSFGNLEVTPPLKGYRFGRIFYGFRDAGYSPGHLGDDLGEEVEKILNSNKKYQDPVKIPTNWLSVGHVDEFMSFVPNLKAGTKDKPFKLLIASPRVAIDLCRKLKKAKLGTSLICEGKTGKYEVSVNDFLKKSFLGKKNDLLKVNGAINTLLRKIKKTVRKEFGLNKKDIIEIPVIFNGKSLKKGKVNRAIARTGGMVNCLVVKPRVIIPKPFGPKNKSGKDIFESYTKRKLRTLGLKVYFVDDWDNYHIDMGEIHCGTNAKRVPPKDWEWWKEK
jgi:protein-arginine deiminase